MATGTKLMKEISDQFLICKICLETFKEPKTLVCLHTFCCDCLQKQNDSDASRPSRYAVYSRYITCPLCRKKTEIPSGGVKRLPDNFLVSNLTEVVNKRSRCKVPPCEICHTVRPRRNEACSKCLDCSKLLCKNCVELHMTTKVTQKHSLIDIEGEKDIECKSHPEEIVRFYCEPCEKCICVVCTFQDHRDHEVCCFSEGFEKYKAALDMLLQKCKGRMGETGSRLKLIDKYENVIKEIRERIRDLAIAYIAKVRSTEKELLKKIDDLVGDNVLHFIENKNWLQESYENLQSTCNLTEIIMKDKGVEMLLLKKEIQQKMSVLLESDLPTVPSDMMAQVHFVPGDVKLGHISVSNGSELNGVAEEFHESKCQETQTDFSQSRSVTDSATTMKSNVTTKSVEGSVQTDPVKQTTRETCTEAPDMRDKGVHVYSYDSKTKGTMTSMQDTRSLKIQTEKTIIYDQYSQTSEVSHSESSQSAAVHSQTGRSINQYDRSTATMTNGISVNRGSTAASPKTLIRSRKIQTQISSIGIESEEDFISSLSSRSMHSHRTVPTRPRAPVEMVEVETNTVLPVRVVPKMFDKETSPEQVVMKDTFTMASPEARTINTQTLRVRRRDTAIGTDYEGQTSKATSTEKIDCVDTETSMPQVLQESKVTWTEKLSTTDRATCTMFVNTSDRATSTGKVNQGDKTTQVKPESRLKATNTMKTLTHEKEIQTKSSTRDSQTNPIKELLEEAVSVPQMVTQSVATVTDLPASRRESTVSVEKVDMVVETDVVESESKTTETSALLTSHVSTETLDVMTSDKETGTPQVHLIDQWTITPQPQMINTGVSPPRPATMETGVGTNPVITMETGTYTEVVTLRETGTETVVTVADNETLTERIVVSDAQTGIEIRTEDSETSTEIVNVQDEGSMTTEILFYERPETECKETQVSPDREIPISKRHGIQEVQTDRVNINCTICEHQSMSLEDKTFTDSCTMSQLPQTQDVGTMALSIISSACDVSDSETQTSTVTLYDKCVATSAEFDDYEITLSHESRDAATSTESLPYIGLLSEIDVDDIIVVPEAQFDFMLDDTTTDEEDVEMVDTETWTDSYESAEAGTQTLVASTTPEGSPSLARREDQSSNQISVGVNTVSKMTFEKETSTPIRHLFSKGTMTFYISKTDKSTSTFSQTKQIAGSKFGGCVSGKNIIPRIRVEDKDTMTSRAERHDVSTETDPAALDGRITQCISKLRNVSEKLNSPTLRTSCEGDIFFGKSFLSKTRSSDSSGQSSPTVMFDSTSSKEGKISPGSPGEDERQKQLQQLLAETQAILKSKEIGRQDQAQASVKQKHIRNERSPVRKAQPITTLKGRGQVKSKDTAGYRTQSLPRQFSVDCPSNVRLGSQPAPPSRLPLLRYNSAPGRIATVPTQKLQDMKKASQSHQVRGNSPSKIPVKASPVETPPSPSQSEVFSQTQKSSKPQQRPSLPAICETRTPSSCSDISTSSYMSAASGDSVTPSLTPSNISSSDVQTDYSGTRRTSKESETGESADEAAKARTQPPPPPQPQKKDKGLGFMQRFLSKKKKEPEKNGAPPASPGGSSGGAAKYRQKQSKPEPPKEPPLPKKSRPFVYVRQRIMSIQHDNEEEMEEKKKNKSKSKQKKEKPEKTPASPKCKHGAKGKKSRDSDSDLSDRH